VRKNPWQPDPSRHTDPGAAAPALVILAAGVASRYGSLKQLEAVGPGGEALLEYSAYDAWRAGFGRVILVVRPETEDRFRKTAGAGIARRMPVCYVHQALDGLPPGFAVPAGRRKPWGTGHAVLAAEGAVAEPFAVVNADDFYGRESFVALGGFLAGAASSEGVFAMPGFDVAATLTDSGPVTRALCRVDGDGWLEDVVERRGLVRGGDAAAGRVVSMNMWGFTPAVFGELRRLFAAFLAAPGGESSELLLPDVVRTLIRERRARVKVLAGAGEWCGVTFRDDLPRVVRTIAELVDRGVYPRQLWGSTG
jgi:MobA-like NTP transferase domain